jgi:hypothetical protein
MFDNIINEDFLPPDDDYEDDENCNSDSSSDEEDNNANLEDKNEDPKDDPSDSDGEKHNKPNIIKDANKKKVKYPKNNGNNNKKSYSTKTNNKTNQNYYLIDNYDYFNNKVKFSNFCNRSFIHKRSYNEMINQQKIFS